MILFILIGIIIAWAVFSYNNLIRLQNRVKEAWADIEVQLKRRYDLIPNLVESVKGYAKHESGVFEKVTEARAKAMGASSGKEKAGAENMLSGALKSLFAVAENYPQLKANENFGKLQDELSDTENKIQAARRFYNTNTRDLNTSIETFPSNVMARMFNFSKAEFFDAEPAAEQPVNVKF